MQILDDHSLLPHNTFGLDVRTTFHEIAEATDAPKPKNFFIRRVA